MAWHAPRHWVNTKVHFTTIVLQQLGELFDYMLRLGNRHTVTGDDRHVGRGLQNIVGVVDRNRLDLALDHGFLTGNAGEAGKQHIRERAIHRLTHNLSKDDAGSAHQRPRNNQGVVIDRKTRRTRRQTGVGVQERDHHGHIRAADRNHRHDAKEQCQADHHIEPVRIRGVHAEHHRTAEDAQHHKRIHNLLARERDGTAANRLRKLAVGHQRPRQRHATDQNRQHDSHQGKGAGIGR